MNSFAPLTAGTRYGVALIAALLAIALRLSAAPLFGTEVPYIFFFPAIVASAWWGGRGPGWLTVALCAAAADFFLLAPLDSFAVHSVLDRLTLLTFVTSGLVLTEFGERTLLAGGRARYEHQRLHTTLQSIADGVIATDAGGLVTVMNPVATALTGWDADLAVGKPISEVFDIRDETTREPSRQPVLDVLSQRARRGLTTQAIVVARDGTEHPIDNSGAPILRPDGTVGGAVLVFRDVSDARRTSRLLEQSEVYFRTLTDTAPVMIWMSGVDGRATYFNKRWLEYTGRGPAEQMGDGWTEGLHRDDAPACLQAYRGAFVDRRAFELEFRLRRADGDYGWVLSRSEPRAGADGRFIGFIGSCVEITDRKTAEAEREQILARERDARAAAETANRAKDEMLATLSHELRTPLNAIHGWVHLLRHEMLEGNERTRALEIIERNARAQALLIDDLLDVSAFITGKLQLKMEPVDVVSIVGDVIEGMRPAAEAKRIRVSQTASGPAVTRGDARRLQQLFWNLLSNAVKFTAAGGAVGVEIDCTADRIEVCVQDTGQGIAAHLLPRIFDRFAQGDASTTRTHGGLGLGLAIVRHLAEMHGGTVAAASDGPGRGALFTVSLPVNAAAAASVPAPFALTQRAGRARADGTPLRGTRVMVVDDHHDARDLLKLILDADGAEVATAGSMEDALSQLAGVRPEVVITDIGMAGHDGFSLLKAVRETVGFERVPVVALTGYPESSDVFTSAGFNAHLKKPIDISELKQVIARLAEQG